jgi:hypothetical protein
MAQAHSAEVWSHLHSNPLELSSLLRLKRLTEGYYASLAMVFKLVKLPQDSRFGTKFWLYSISRCYSNRRTVPRATVTPCLQYLTTTVPPEFGCTITPIYSVCPPARAIVQRPIPQIWPTGPILGLLHRRRRHPRSWRGGRCGRWWPVDLRCRDDLRGVAEGGPA